MARILIVEDEVLVAGQLRKYIEKIGHEWNGHATSYEEAEELLAKQKPELVLLDIHLFGKRSGIEVAQLINEKYRIPFIFLTSHFEKSTLEQVGNTHPAGYLVKPYQEESLSTTITISLYNHRNQSIRPDNTIEFTEGRKKHILASEKIHYLSAEHVYTRIIKEKEEILIRKSLNEMMELLPPTHFLRVHRSYIVNLRHIKQVSATYIRVGDHKIPIGKTFREDVQKSIGA